MKTFSGKALSWSLKDGAIEVVLDRAPCNEIGSATLDELEQFVAVLASLQTEAHALIISSARKEGFCAGADLREVYRRSQAMAARRATRRHPRFPRTHSSRDECD